MLHPRSVRRHIGGPEDFADRVTGRRVETGRIGEASTSGYRSTRPTRVLGHLGMSGQLLVSPSDQEPQRHLRVVLGLDNGLDCASPTSGCSAGCSSRRGGADAPGEIAHIALDPLDPAFDDVAFQVAVRVRRTGIKRALLDQALISGVGNIYADEALWRCPAALCAAHGHDAPHRDPRLLDEIRTVMTRALGEGGTSFDSLYVNVNGESGYFGGRWPSMGARANPVSAAVHPSAGTPS